MSWKTLVIFAAVLGALVIWDRAVSTRLGETRSASARIGSLVHPSVFDERPVAAVRLDLGHEQIHLYVYSDGLWRCATVYGAPVNGQVIEAIIPAMLEAEGVVRTSDPSDAASFGFGGDDTVRLSLCGSQVFTDPAGDVIFAIDLGRSIQATGGSYVRPVGSDAIWAIDKDLRALLEIDPASNLPPLLDPHVIAQNWPGVQLGPGRIVIESRNQPTLTITRRDREPQPSDPPGTPPWEWIVEEGESAYVGDLFQVTSYVVYLTRAQYAGILAPRPLEELGLDPPFARVSMQSAEGHPLELHIGGPGPRGGVAVLNTHSQMLFEVEMDLVARMVPQLDTLLSGEQGNPWERWMMRR